MCGQRLGALGHLVIPWIGKFACLMVLQKPWYSGSAEKTAGLGPTQMAGKAILDAIQ